MMAIAAIVPHYLLGIAAGAAILGTLMPTAGFIIPISNLPRPVWFYPVHFLAYHTFSMHGLMHNEFLGTDGWGCPCEIQPGGCDGPCTLTGEEALDALRFPSPRSKWWDVAIVLLMAIVFRAFFAINLKLRELLSK